VWDALGDDECRKKALIIETSQLSLTLDQYLRKHKFCSGDSINISNSNDEENGKTSNMNENSSKPYHHHYQHHTQNHNYNSNKENSESPLEEQHQQHIHVRNDKNFISNLIFKAESEIQGRYVN